MKKIPQKTKSMWAKSKWKAGKFLTGEWKFKTQWDTIIQWSDRQIKKSQDADQWEFSCMLVAKKLWYYKSNISYTLPLSV